MGCVSFKSNLMWFNTQTSTLSDTIVFLEDCTYKEMRNGFVEFIHQVSFVLLFEITLLEREGSTNWTNQTNMALMADPG
jgi:hypothetical protein